MSRFNVGDLVRITRPGYTAGNYKRDDLLVVDEIAPYGTNTFYARHTGSDEKFGPFVYDREAELVLTADEFQTLLAKESGRHLKDAFEVAYKPSVAPQPLPVKTYDEIRGDAIRLAKKRIKDIKEIGRSWNDRRSELGWFDLAGIYSSKFSNRFFDVKFDVNHAERKVTCTAFICTGPHFNGGKLVPLAGSSQNESTGTARCSDGDVFNVHLGMVIALYRALGLTDDETFTMAPQPTEVRVGQLVTYGHGGSPKKVTSVGATHAPEPNGRWFVSHEEGITVYEPGDRSDHTWIHKTFATIVDDSNAKH